MFPSYQSPSTFHSKSDSTHNLFLKCSNPTYGNELFDSTPNIPEIHHPKLHIPNFKGSSSPKPQKYLPTSTQQTNSYNSSNERNSRHKDKITPNWLSNPDSGSQRSKLASGVAPFNEHFDEFSEQVAISPFENLDEELVESSKRQKHKPLIVVQTKTLTPYLSNIRSNPFSKEFSTGSPMNFEIESIIEKIEQRKKQLKNNIFFNFSVLDRICDYLEPTDLLSLKNMNQIYQGKDARKFFKRKTLKLLLLSFDQTQFEYMWRHFTTFQSQKTNLQNFYQQSSNKTFEFDEDIKKDLDRTLPQSEIFQTEEKVLRAICNTYPDLGYVQGMNSLVGVPLSFLSEEESFSMFMHFFEELQMKKIFQSNFEGLSVLNYQLEMYLEHYLPEISRFLNEHSMSLSYYTYTWFITLFSDNLQLPTVIKLWSFFLIKGPSFLLQFSLAIFSLNQDNILKLNIDEVGSYLKNKLWEFDLKDNQIFAHALQFKVTNRLMKELENFYYSGKPFVRLTNSKDTDKPSWECYEKPVSSPIPKTKPNRRLKPFFQTVIDTITIDFPDSFKQLFRRSMTMSHNQSFLEPSRNQSNNILEENKRVLHTEGNHDLNDDETSISKYLRLKSSSDFESLSSRRPNFKFEERFLPKGKKSQFKNFSRPRYCTEINMTEVEGEDEGENETENRPILRNGRKMRRIFSPKKFHEAENLGFPALNPKVILEQTNLSKDKIHPKIKRDMTNKERNYLLQNKENFSSRAQIHAKNWTELTNNVEPDASETDFTNTDEAKNFDLGCISLRKGFNQNIMTNH